MRSTYGHENPVKTFPLVPQLDLRANQSASEAAERPTWGCLRGRSPFIRPPGGAVAKRRGENGATQKKTAGMAVFFVWPLTIHFKAYSYLSLYQMLAWRSQGFN